MPFSPKFLVALVSAGLFLPAMGEDVSLRERLSAYATTPVLRARVDEALADLDAQSYAARRRAMAVLMEASSLRAELEKALETVGPEGRVALAIVLQAHENAGVEEKLRLLMRRIIVEEAKGLVPLILQAWEGRVVSSNDTSRLCREAMQASLLAEDLPVVRKALTSPTPLVREMALYAVQRLSQNRESLVELLTPLLTDASEPVRWRAAVVLAQCEERAALTVLAALLDSEIFYIRHQSHELLSAMTAQDFDYFSDGVASDRRPAARLWQRWVAKFGQRAEVDFSKTRYWLDAEDVLTE